MISFSNPDSIEKLKRELKTFLPEGKKVMFTTRKIDSGAFWLLAAFILPLCLAIPAPCAAASSADLAARADHRLLPAQGLAADDPEIIIPKPPPPPPSARV
ncbi:MAG TPA: hypothetical protein VGM86_02905 [Thermoanaerobaculia bacterium]|jgi:hypothetical protein